MRPFSYGRFADLRTRLLGSYQPANAALAIEAAEALRARGWAVADDAVRRGVAETVWPGRFEIVRAAAGEPTVVVDGGHNPQGARALADSLADVFPGCKPVFVVGVLEDKDYPSMLRRCCRSARRSCAWRPTIPARFLPTSWPVPSAGRARTSWDARHARAPTLRATCPTRSLVPASWPARTASCAPSAAFTR